jgi:hypothetical protein
VYFCIFVFCIFFITGSLKSFEQDIVTDTIFGHCLFYIFIFLYLLYLLSKAFCIFYILWYLLYFRISVFFVFCIFVSLCFLFCIFSWRLVGNIWIKYCLGYSYSDHCLFLFYIVFVVLFYYFLLFSCILCIFCVTWLLVYLYVVCWCLYLSGTHILIIMWSYYWCFGFIVLFHVFWPMLSCLCFDIYSIVFVLFCLVLSCFCLV